MSRHLKPKENKKVSITDFFVKKSVPSPSLDGQCSPTINDKSTLLPVNKDESGTNTPPIGFVKKEQKYLAIKNRHPRDAHISFKEENHEYTVLGEKGYTSVTTFVHKHFPKFDNEFIINNILSSKKITTDPTYKYYGMTKEQILADWEINRNLAAEAGTNLHYDIEAYFNLDPQSNESIEYDYFINFVKDFPELIPYRTEWTVYYEEYRISGSIDMVFENPDGTIQIYDWKRTKGLEYEGFGNKRAITPCISHIPDTNFWHYSIQLNMYKRILETKYDKKVTGLYLICLHPLNSPKTYERVEVPFLDNDISQLLIWWKENHL
jgi:ATP-dependent exoDNAse (exonuclease V) beta subunit